MKKVGVEKILEMQMVMAVIAAIVLPPEVRDKMRNSQVGKNENGPGESDEVISETIAE